ncbi:MAG: hypothetical protein QOI15_545 [Pseudonocardiales bacterium]|jgi:hypothetical protein|nr:hypothetical protein [Pseudonocardiales bacterium]
MYSQMTASIATQRHTDLQHSAAAARRAQIAKSARTTARRTPAPVVARSRSWNLVALARRTRQVRTAAPRPATA